MFSQHLKPAMQDYLYLLNRNYPQKSSLKLVGDKYQLSGEERSILYRGISATEISIRRKEKLKPGFQGDKVYIDTYNVLFTLANYLNGRPVFISTDGFLRDAGELHGRFHRNKLLEKTLQLMYKYLLAFTSNEYILLLDQPVSNSLKLARSVNKFMEEHTLKGFAETCNSPDSKIVLEARENDLVCSSDSVIIEKVTAGIFDLSLHILNSSFGKTFPDIRDFLSGD